jgi:WS/DGAT/MGAT family acyltransferase
MSMFYQTWGSGRPVIALHPLALESTVFAGVAALLDQHGMRTLAADMPGFGRSPVGNEPLTPARLALPVIELARSLESPPILLGMSLGARVALEAALTEPGAFRGLALVAPHFPWRSQRWPLSFAHLLFPGLAERLPLELAWPTLKRVSERLDATERLQNDWMARACVRVAYYLSCPATRRHFVSASRELMLEPPFGPTGIWTRLPGLEVPAAFLWAGRDRLVPASHADGVAQLLPAGRHLRVPCCGHFMNGEHYRCFNQAMKRTVLRAAEAVDTLPHGSTEVCECVATAGGRESAHARPVRLSAVQAAPAPTREPARAPMDGSRAHEPAEGAQAASARRRLSGEDALFVFGETATMPMHTIGTLILDPSTVRNGQFGFERLVRTIAGRIHLMPPYRQRLVTVPLGLDRPLFADDPDFRVENHVRRLSVKPPGTLRELADEVGRIAAEPLDRSRPLWEMSYVDGLEGGRVALVTKMHHCLLDGASGASQLANLLDLEPEPTSAGTPPAWRPGPLPSRIGLAAKALVPNVPKPLAVASLVANTAVGLYKRAAIRRQRSSTWEAMTSIVTGAPRTRFTRAITAKRIVAFASTSLNDVKLVKNAFGVTVNDVVLAACTLAVRRYLREENDLPSEPLLCAVPVSMKSEAEKRDFSNKVATMSVRLPLDVEDGEELLHAIHDETAAAKREFFAVESDLLIGWLDRLAPNAIGIGARAFSALRLADWLPSMANLVVSNMPGPPVPLYMAGARVAAIYPMGPIGEGMGLNITVLSNMDRVDVGLLACADTVPGLWRIAEGFEAAVDELTTAAKARAAA